MVLKSGLNGMFWIFKEHFYYDKNGVYWPFLGSKFKLFSKTDHEIFLEFYLMTHFKKLFKMTASYFQEKLLLCAKWGKWIVFGSKMQFNFSLNVFFIFL